MCASSPQLQTTFDGAVDAFRRNGAHPRYRVREFDEFDRILYLLADDEFVFGNDIPGLQDPTSPLVALRVVADEPLYPVYLLFNTRSAKPATALLAGICQEVAHARFPMAR